MKSKLIVTLCFLFSISSYACDSTQVKLDSSWIGPNPYPGYVINFNCLDSNLILHFSDPIKTASVNTFGENFFILTPLLDTLYASQTIADTNAFGIDSTLLLNVKFSNSLFVNGNYFLVVKPDKQGRPIENTCGAKWLSDSIAVKVQDCFSAKLDLTSITKTSATRLKLDWIADTTSFPTCLFGAYSVYRRTPLDSVFIKIGANTNISELSFTDSIIPSGFIGYADYYIALQLDKIEVATTDTMSYYLVLSQTEEELKAKWILNPSRNNYSLNVSQKSKLTLIDLSGRLVYSKNLEIGHNKITLDLLSPGLYLAFIDNHFNRKLIKP